jgi:3-deoxy-D-manno-octulosonate 8-phosphate phosphatase (KDO 8-P phosphatase)
MKQEATFSKKLLKRAAKIKLLLMDCDGVLTNGHIYLLPDGNGGLFETKTFDSQDGIALQWAHQVGIHTGIISGRTSPAVKERARTAHMKYLYEGNTLKLPLFEEILADSKLAPDEIGYVGDDVTDLPIMARVGLAAAPSSSRSEALAAAHFVAPSPGGSGAVRDVIELLLKAQKRWPEIMAKYDI